MVVKKRTRKLMSSAIGDDTPMVPEALLWSTILPSRISYLFRCKLPGS